MGDIDNTRNRLKLDNLKEDDRNYVIKCVNQHFEGRE